MKINRLRLLGFKSFVEPTELLIEPGLTGVLGPNGCGKSNLLEALRWVMGETSYKSMRASAMDDVIFSGTDKRPARNAAEVTIFIDNATRQAPAEFNDHDVIEITRRIERELGSAYRINGKDARARDVKLLFEDAATGARSPALVRQGQIGEIVNAKPEQRRRILEDAAGIAGLHSRRHEAELRLKHAETNMARLQDVLGQLNSQVENLKRQARHARRYKELSLDIRKSEAMLMHLAWLDAQANANAEETALGEAMRMLGLASQAESAMLRREAEQAEALPPLREQEAVRGAVLHRLKVEQENFEKEAQRTVDRQNELMAQAEHFERDLQRERGLIGEAAEMLAHLDKEAAQHNEEAVLAADYAVKAKAQLAELEAATGAADARLNELNTMVADDRARRRALESTKTERASQLERLERQLAGVEAQAREIAARAPDISTVTVAQVTGQTLARKIAEIEAGTLEAEAWVANAAAETEDRRGAATDANLAASRLKTEVETLQKLLRPTGNDGLPPIVDMLRVAPGYEMALGAALGDDLDAPTGADAPMHWRLLDASAAAEGADLPAGTEPLSLHVDGAEELTPRLHQIGIVPRDKGAALQSRLRPGQRLVSIEGDLWRWDGFVAAAHAPSAAAMRLAERNRLVDLERRDSELRREADQLAIAAVEAVSVYETAQEDARQLRQTWREMQAQLAGAREALTKAEAAARETEQKLAAVTEAKERVDEQLVEARAKLAETAEALAALPPMSGLDEELDAAKAVAEEHRTALSEARAAAAALQRETQIREQRLEAINAEKTRWSNRSNGANAQIKALEDRRAEAMDEIEALADLPQQINDKRQKLMSALSDAERERGTAAEALAAAEAEHKAIAQALREAQGSVSEQRERRARVEARLEAARERRTAQAQQIRDSLDCAPDECLGIAGLAADAAVPPLADAERKLAKLKADRERLGGVNLAADDELERLAGDFKTIDDERLDLEQAIAKLRGAINQLNKEGRTRLKEAFDKVNEHFKALFGTLFSGGEARLELVEGDDPLESGLEIIARPPGKKPATLSLLSGGEQSLTALSLIFAVFLTNPSPICVLDEVDAPLDDSNVDRFCAMMERMAADTDTRFLVITHHPMTMARMNRLFGVTMGEKGVSQLVSVDLATAERIIDAA